jgi:hypothetical protein
MDIIRKYGLALIASEYEGINGLEDVKSYMLHDSIKKACEYFFFNFDKNLKNEKKFFTWANYKSENLDKFGAHIITKSKKGLIKCIDDILCFLSEEKVDLQKKVNLTNSLTPLGGEFNNGKSRRSENVTLLEASLILLTGISLNKPSYREVKERKMIIPDLDLEDLVLFIKLFKRMYNSETKDLLKSNSNNSDPLIMYGNFPNAPKYNFFKEIVLLASISNYIKRAKDGVEIYKNLTKSFKNKLLYVISNESKFEIYRLNDKLIDFIVEIDLVEIVNAIFNTYCINDKEFFKTNLFRFKFSRFLNNMDDYHLKRLIKTTVLYDSKLEQLFSNYFLKNKNMDEKVLNSAKSIGRKINLYSFLAIENREKIKDDKERMKIEKIKNIQKIESIIHNSKNPIEMFSRITRQLQYKGNVELGEDCEVFINAMIDNKIKLEDGKNLILIYGRINYNNKN